MGEERKGSSKETFVKDPWTRTKWGGAWRVECGGGWAGQGRVMGTTVIKQQ